MDGIRCCAGVQGFTTRAPPTSSAVRLHHQTRSRRVLQVVFDVGISLAWGDGLVPNSGRLFVCVFVCLAGSPQRCTPTGLEERLFARAAACMVAETCASTSIRRRGERVAGPGIMKNRATSRCAVQQAGIHVGICHALFLLVCNPRRGNYIWEHVLFLLFLLYVIIF